MSKIVNALIAGLALAILSACSGGSGSVPSASAPAATRSVAAIKSADITEAFATGGAIQRVFTTQDVFVMAPGSWAEYSAPTPLGYEIIGVRIGTFESDPGGSYWVGVQDGVRWKWLGPFDSNEELGIGTDGFGPLFDIQWSFQSNVVVIAASDQVPFQKVIFQFWDD